MSKRNKERPMLPVTRKQQMESLRKLKAEEIAEKLAENIREAVSEEVERVLQPFKSTVLQLVDRMVEIERIDEPHEGDSVERQERTEATKISEGDKVVSGQNKQEQDGPSTTGDEGPSGG